MGEFEERVNSKVVKEYTGSLQVFMYSGIATKQSHWNARQTRALELKECLPTFLITPPRYQAPSTSRISIFTGSGVCVRPHDRGPWLHSTYGYHATSSHSSQNDA